MYIDLEHDDYLTIRFTDDGNCYYIPYPEAKLINDDNGYDRYDIDYSKGQRVTDIDSFIDYIVTYCTKKYKSAPNGKELHLLKWNLECLATEFENDLIPIRQEMH